MLRSTLRILGLVLALGAGTAHAFEETKQKVQAAEPDAGDAKPKTSAPLNLDGTGTSIDPAPPASSGSDIRIPGLGKLGVWPKLDFGLELLYGGRDAAKADELDRGRPDPSSDGVQIKGHIKHRW